jgi:hypothetical protein
MMESAGLQLDAHETVSIGQASVIAHMFDIPRVSRAKPRGQCTEKPKRSAAFGQATA